MKWERQCPICHGKGGEYEDVAQDGGPWRWEDCPPCEGTGTIRDKRWYFVVLGALSVDARREKRFRKKMLQIEEAQT